MSSRVRDRVRARVEEDEALEQQRVLRQALLCWKQLHHHLMEIEVRHEFLGTALIERMTSAFQSAGRLIVLTQARPHRITVG